MYEKRNVEQGIIYEHFRLASIREYDNLWIERIVIIERSAVNSKTIVNKYCAVILATFKCPIRFSWFSSILITCDMSVMDYLVSDEV